ncbi:MAG: arsenite methyltransferase [Desulfatitalea sp.]|nr:arsenite methyltransferase [Desulfatitalea sp.]
MDPTKDNERHEAVRQAVRSRYGQIATSPGCGCGPSPSSCCGGGAAITPSQIAQLLGYSSQDFSGLPAGANLGLGCGNPKAIAALKPGETVLDLGSGGGFDCFLAAREVGPTGRVIVVSKARANAAQAGAHNVEFRLGEIEHLPVADASVDVILSNCVINLSPDKPQVYRDAFRVLKPGGRLAISDMVAIAPLPEEMRKEIALLTACVAGAETIDGLKRILAQIGFTQIHIQLKDEIRQAIQQWAPGRKIEDYVGSATIEAVKP